ncbi:saccharopine dehydrogenase family protein [Wenzhouxiangella sediminis]|uniref:Saccharopine dehydrogenase n=1 Tax=Wenzhouxiangella sediminis TaxID=1792836 RepID=A0A3E1K625_9GAMM|nr:saccharopine dehydrogenase NADP-binding domain-containing protein [Wenzhouxiangella sediminis]RFF29471.1 saccharopine dehydrogenase [Wenzhouxiangella sediminis]
MSEREFDIVLMGATGFTGRLVAEHLVRRHGVGGQLKWALAGRSREKLEKIRIELGETAAGLPLIVADSHDRGSLDEMVNRTRVVCTTVGPYALHGSDLVAACAANGTDYCDLSGEVPWMRRMLDQHGDAAAKSGARIVHCCGFDSIPSDMGVWFLQREAQERLGQSLERVRMRVKAAKGGLSGGTYASMLNIVEEARRDKEVARVLKNPYALCPPDAREGERQPYVSSALYDPVFEVWTAPFVMAAINTRVVFKANALSGFSYGREFRYDEAVMTGRGFSGRMKATMVSLGMGAFALGAALGPTRALLKKMVLPKPGEGPSAEAREAGFFKIVIDGRNDGGDQSLRVAVSGDRDPGYGSTSKMLGETALALALDLGADERPGGMWTPSTALGEKLLKRLREHAGLKFEVLEG